MPACPHYDVSSCGALSELTALYQRCQSTTGICSSVIVALTVEALLWYFTPPLWPLWQALSLVIWLVASIGWIPTLFLRDVYVIQ